MPNNLLTSSLISNTALAMFQTAAPFIATANRGYERDFLASGYKIGDTLNIRRVNRIIVGDGPTATPQPVQDQVETLTINHQYHAMIAYTIADLALRIDDFARIFLQPAIQSIIANMERDICKAAELQLSDFVGTPGTPINSFAKVDAAGAKLLEMGVNIYDNAYLVLNTRDASSLKGALLNNFTPILNEEIVRTSALGHLSYFDVFQSQNVVVHTAGAGPTLHPGDTLTVNGAVSSGNTLVLAGGTASVTNYFLPGDLISIASVYSVNPLTRASTGNNAQFVVTAPANSDGAGAITVSVNIEGTGINSTAGDALQNVSGPVPNGAVVTAYGSYNVNVAYPERALDIVAPPLYKIQTPFSAVSVDPETGMSLAVAQAGDIQGYQNFLRIDLLCGFVWHSQYAVKVIS